VPLSSRLVRRLCSRISTTYNPNEKENLKMGYEDIIKGGEPPRKNTGKKKAGAKKAAPKKAAKKAAKKRAGK
jgi:hypothetical protein